MFKVELIVGARTPQTQIICVVGVIPRDGGVVGLSDYKLTTQPLDSLYTLLVSTLLGVTTESNCVNHVRSFNLPGVSLLEPVVRDLHLSTVFNDLLKYTIVIAYTIAPCWYLHSCKTVEEASGKAA